jgi:hypothetical protein
VVSLEAAGSARRDDDLSDFNPQGVRTCRRASITSATKPLPVAAAAREFVVRLLPLPDEGQMHRQAEEAERALGRDSQLWVELVEQERRRGVTQSTIECDIAVARIGDFAIGGVPAEAFSATALDAAARLESDTAFLCGYVNGCVGYLPTAEEFEFGGYEVLWNPVVWGTSPVSGFRWCLRRPVMWPTHSWSLSGA